MRETEDGGPFGGGGEGGVSNFAGDSRQYVGFVSVGKAGDQEECEACFNDAVHR